MSIGFESKTRNLWEIKELNGGAGEARTPDLRFRKLQSSPSVRFGRRCLSLLNS
jgi:hypothetical protein